MSNQVVDVTPVSESPTDRAVVGMQQQMAIRQAEQRRDESASFITMLERAARDPKVDIDKMRALLDMKKEIIQDQREVEYNDAMAACQAEIGPVVARSKNTHTSSKYANLEAIDSIVRPIYTKHGFGLSFDSEQMPNGAIKVTCEVTHAGGFKKVRNLVGDLDTSGSGGKANKTSIQGLGSTVTYLRRYLTCMVFNIVIGGEDNDGNNTAAQSKVVTQAQVNQIITLLGGPGERVAKFCQAYELKTVQDLPAADFDKAVAEIKHANAKLAQKQQ